MLNLQSSGDLLHINGCAARSVITFKQGLINRVDVIPIAAEIAGCVTLLLPGNQTLMMLKGHISRCQGMRIGYRSAHHRHFTG